MASIVRTPVQGLKIRVTLVDECGEVVPGTCGYAVSKCFASVAMSDNVEDGDEFKVKAADGTFCVNQRSSPQLNWIENTITLLQVDPELVSLLTGSPVVYNAAGSAVGFQTTVSDYATASFALELWTGVGKVVGDVACPAGGTLYGYFLEPWLTEGTVGDITIENGAANIVVNAITSSGNGWGHGPYDVTYTSLGAATPLLAAIPSDAHRHMQWTTYPPPAVTNGCAFLDAVS